METAPTPVFLPGKSLERKSLAGCSPWDCGVRHDLATKSPTTGKLSLGRWASQEMQRFKGEGFSEGPQMEGCPRVLAGAATDLATDPQTAQSASRGFWSPSRLCKQGDLDASLPRYVLVPQALLHSYMNASALNKDTSENIVPFLFFTFFWG